MAFLTPSIQAVRQNLAPMLLLQGAGGLLVVGYFRSDSIRAWADSIGHFKAASGLPGAFVAGFVAGGLLAELAKGLTGRTRQFGRAEWIRMLWTGLVYGLVGVLVDLLYRYQGVWFGHGTDLRTLTLKTVVDMTLFSPFLSIPLAAGMIGWWRTGFDRGFWRRAFTFQFIRDEIATALPLCWAYWIPFLYLTYSLPPNLQFPFAILAESAWSILFVFLVSEEVAGTPH